jgi:hypothetical protein
MKRLGVLALLFLSAAGAAAIGAGCGETGCQADSDCQTGRICTAGVCANPRWTHGAGGSTGAGGTGGQGVAAPAISTTAAPSTIDMAALQSGIETAYSSGGASTAADYVLATLHVNDVIVECDSSGGTCTSLRLLDADLYNPSTRKWIVGDGNKIGLCQGTVCRYHTVTRYIYVGGLRVLDLMLSLEPGPESDAGL